MRGNRYSNVEVFQTGKLEWKPLVTDWTKEEAKMAKIVSNIHVYIANNSIFVSIMSQFLARSIALKECYLIMNFFKKVILQFLKDPQKYKSDGQALMKCDFLKGPLLKYFFSENMSLVVRKPYTKFRQLLLSKTAILEHP